LLLHPDVAARSCEDCQTYLYFDKGPGEFGARVERGGKPCKRPKGIKPPCGWCPKIAPGDEPRPSNAQELTPENFQAYVHFRECEAVGSFPNDATVRRNAAIIKHVDKSVQMMAIARSGFLRLGTE
jgi:hypothetical protein